MFKDRIMKKAEEIKEELIAIRRDIHAHPEPGLKEVRTAALVAEKLRSLGLEVKTNVGVTGVIGLLRGKHPGKTLLLRADMDCLAMPELNDVDYKSQNPGFMHACGHDVHVTWLLGTAMVLSELKDEIHGNIKFLFQPAEETVGGADRMIKEGALEDPKVDAAIGAHVWDTLPVGKVAVKYGSMMAAPDMFKVTIHGKGGHGAYPHTSVDPIIIACQVVIAFQTVVSRKIDPLENVVITVGKFNSGSAHNIIPDTAEIVGTVRTLTYELRDRVPKIMEELVKGIVESNGATYEFTYDKYFPPVINNDEMTSLVKEAAGEIVGNENIVILQKPVMGGEDFSYFLEKVPGAYFNIGTYNPEKGLTAMLHNSKFNVDEDIIHKSSAVFAQCALKYLNQK